jgi:PAS domain S-box-containing protein
MKRLHAPLTIIIWFPFAIALSAGLVGMTYYYSEKQAELIRKDAALRIEEFSTMLSQNVEISMIQQDMDGLAKTIKLATKTDDFEFFAFVQSDSSGENEQVFVSIPENINPSLVLKPDTIDYIFRKVPVNADLVSGYVIIATSVKKMNERIHNLEIPLFYMMGVVLAISLLIFYFFAQMLARQFSYLTGIANELTAGNFEIGIEESSRASEVLSLNKALVKLRSALQLAKNKNDDFNRKLEAEIQLRTRDLEDARQRLLEAQEVAQIGNYEYNLETGEWQSSETIHRILLVPSNHPTSFNSLTSALRSTDQHLLDNLFKTIINNEKAFQQDFRLSAKNGDGEEKWISISGRSFFSEPGKNSIIRGTIQEISTRKRIENEVRKLSLVAEKTSNCVIITDVNRRIIWVNESSLKITGYSREEIIGNTPAMFQFEKTDPETTDYIRKKLNKVEEVNAKILNRSKNGREYWLQINIVPLWDDENQHIGFMAVETDITDRVKFELELKKSEENYRSILENASELIHSIGPNGQLIWANRAWREKLGMVDREISGIEISRFLDDKTKADFDRILPILVNGESISGMEFTFLSNDGSSLILEGRAIPLLEGEKIIGSQYYLHDITSIRKAENALKQLLELTQRQNERLRNFTHIVSHNLRSHGSNLSGLINLLNLELPDFRENIFYHNFEKAVGNLMDVIQNLSEVALIHTEEDKEFGVVDLKYAIEKAAATVFGLAQNNDVQIELLVKENYKVKGDSGYIDSILLNLLTNGIKYRATNRKSFIQIQVDNSSDGLLRIDVRDNGLGIDLDRQGRKIFGMYKTFHNHPDARGVGLFLTKNQVEAMGGRIEVSSRVDEGSVFSVFLRTAAEPVI